jgi:hypothetical protein
MDDATRRAAILRTRAAELRRLAHRVDGAAAGALWHRSGPGTWVGPTASACLDALVACRRLLDAAASELRDAAARLDHRAELAETEARLPLGLR